MGIKLEGKSKRFILAAGSLFLFSLTLAFLLMLQEQVKKPKMFQPRAEEYGFSLKKGVGGGATLSQLNDLKVSWFHNWGPLPNYKTLDNYDPEVWKKFVPLFFGKSYQGVGAAMEKICSRTTYCGKGNYYLAGNEPDQTLQDAIEGSEDQVRDAVFMQGEVIKRVKAYDPTAKFIVLGTAIPNRFFATEYIKKWKSRWQNDAVIADLPSVISGWHFHTYTCHPSNTSIEQFKSAVDSEMQTTFGKKIVNEEIWITEMGRLDGGDPFGIMDCLINKYELSTTAALVNRYAWFYLGCTASTLRYCPFPAKNYNFYISEAITDLGKKYANLPAIAMPTSPSTPLPTLTLTPSATPTRTVSPTQTPTLTPTPTPTMPPLQLTNTPVPNTPIPTQGNCPLKSSGDANCNGRIDLFDFFLWRGEFLSPTLALKADFNGDGRVNLFDFFRWRSGFLSG